MSVPAFRCSACLTLTIVPSILIATALTACAIPAYRAARTDPKIALRYE